MVQPLNRHISDTSNDLQLSRLCTPVCRYTDEYTHTCTYMYTHTHTQMYTHAHPPTCAHTQMHTHTQAMYTCIPIHVHTWHYTSNCIHIHLAHKCPRPCEYLQPSQVYTPVCPYTCTLTHTHAHTTTHTITHTHIHKHTHACACEGTPSTSACVPLNGTPWSTSS